MEKKTTTSTECYVRTVFGEMFTHLDARIQKVYREVYAMDPRVAAADNNLLFFV